MFSYYSIYCGLTKGYILYTVEDNALKILAVSLVVFGRYELVQRLVKKYLPLKVSSYLV